MGARGSHSQRIWITLDTRVPAEAAAWETYQAMGGVMPDRARAELLRHIVVAGLESFATTDVKTRRANRAAANALEATNAVLSGRRRRVTALPKIEIQEPTLAQPVSETKPASEIQPKPNIKIVPENSEQFASNDKQSVKDKNTSGGDGFGILLWDN